MLGLLSFAKIRQIEDVGCKMWDVRKNYKSEDGGALRFGYAHLRLRLEAKEIISFKFCLKPPTSNPTHFFLEFSEIFFSSRPFPFDFAQGHSSFTLLNKI